MECFWLGPGDAAPPLRFPSFSSFEQQRRAAARAALEMAAQSGYDAPDSERDESEEEESDDYGFGPHYGGNGPRYSLLRNALARFNYECEEGARFQWFGETIEGPLLLQEVRGQHRKGCEVCDACPGFGELFFKYDVGVHGAPWSYSKLCMTCGMGIVYAAVQKLDAGRDSDSNQARSDSENDSDQSQSDSGDEAPENSREREQQDSGVPPPAGTAGGSWRGVGAVDGAEQPVVKLEDGAELPVVKLEDAAEQRVVKLEDAAEQPVVKLEDAAERPVIKLEDAAEQPVVKRQRCTKAQ